VHDVRGDATFLADGQPSDTVDDDIFAAVLEGDDVAFRALYRHLHPRLLRYASVLVGADAEDVTAEAWLQIIRDLPRFSGNLDGFRGWTARIVRNRAIETVRARGRRPADPADLDVLAAQPGPDDTARHALDAISTRDAVAMIAALPRVEAEAVLLRAVVGLDATTAGQVLGKRAGTVRVAAHRGLRRLAAQLATPERMPAQRAAVDG